MRYSPFVCLALVVSAPAVAGYGPTYYHPDHNYICLSLNITDQQANDFKFSVPVRGGPSPDAAIVGSAASIVFERRDATPTAGFTPIALFNRKPGWIEDKWVIPYNERGVPKQCVVWDTSRGLGWKSTP